MRRIRPICTTLVLLALCATACGGPPTREQLEIKQAFIRQLVAICAEVDRQLAVIDKKAEPGKAADQFTQFVSQARSQPAPETDDDQFETLLTAMDATARDFRSAQEAVSAGDSHAAESALAQADRHVATADAAAQKYGMPPLDSCPQHESPPTPDPAPTAGWHLRHESLEAVQQIDAAVLDGRIWVAGGLTDSHQATASTEFYDPTIDSWESGPPLPEPVHHAMLVNYRDQLVLIGGFQPLGDDPLGSASAQVLFLDATTGRWSPGPPLHHPRAAAAAAVVGDKIVVAGGRTGNPAQLVDQTEVFDGNSWHDGDPIPVPGDHLAAAGDPNYLYTVGGRTFTAGSNTTSVQRYDPTANRWIILPATPEPVSGAGAAIVDGQLIIAGGEGTTTVSSTVRAFDLTSPTATWTTLPPLNEGRHGLGVAAIGSTLYAIAGSTRAGHTASTRTVGALTFS
jgi:hypothetical protein